LGFWSYREDLAEKDDQDRTMHMVANPKTCSFNILVKEVACGLNHTHLVSKDGYLYSMGSNEYGKLGLGLTDKELVQSASPRLIESIKSVRSVAVGLHHSIAVGKD
jgi:alpha-tubulin suppressor-like RCC1 family protein